MNDTNYKGTIEALHLSAFGISPRAGFTLVEVLTTVLIIGVLTSIAMPMYMRSIERSRATEAMSVLKALNDSIYAYYADKDACPVRFSQLVVTLPSDATAANTATISTKTFQFTLGGATVDVPGTSCKGILATRINGGSYSYTIWNPYTRGTTGKARALQCDGNNEKSIGVCESLGLYREPAQ